MTTPSWLSRSLRPFKYNSSVYSCHLFFLFFKFLFLLYFTLQYCIGFAIHWHESTTGVHEFPNMNTPSHLRPHTIPLDHPHAPAPSILYPASNTDWRFVSCMIVYMFQCHSPKSSYPRPLLQSLKDCSIHLCLFCCLTYRVIITFFLNSIYICVSILYWCFSFWLTSLCIFGSSFIHLIRTDSKEFFLTAE